MASIQNSQRTAILADPVTAFSKAFPDAKEKPVAELTGLQQQYAEIKKQHKEILDQRKKLSRQIGDAKRNGQPVDGLVQAVQEKSTKIDCLKTQLSSLSERILDYFETEKTTEDSAGETLDLAAERAYTEPSTPASQISVKQLSEDKNNDWNRYLDSNPAASIYHRSEWKTLIKDVFGHHGYYFYAHNNGKITGVLPLIRLKSGLFGDFMVSMPYFNYGGAIADSPSIEQALMQSANRLAEKLGITHIEYRDDVEREGLPVRSEKVNMILTLADNSDTLWDTFPSKLRSQIRRAQREDVRLKTGNKDCLDDFYTVFSRNMRDLGTPVYGKAFFMEILQCFTAQSKIVIVYLKGKPVAAAFLLGHKHTLEIPWASTINDVNHLSINMLLYWEVLKFAINNQYRYFDFGRSSKDSGTFRFKRQWGARPKQLYWHYWLPNNAKLPELNPNNPKYMLAISLWKKLPVSITRFIGPSIVKNLP